MSTDYSAISFGKIYSFLSEIFGGSLSGPAPHLCAVRTVYIYAAAGECIQEKAGPPMSIGGPAFHFLVFYCFQLWTNFKISSTEPSMPSLEVLRHRSFHSAPPHLRSVWKL